MTRIILVQCTGQKRDEPAHAQDLYDESDYFVKQRKYAMLKADAWYIQSAKHGLLYPCDYIEPYDKHARDIDDPGAWGEIIAGALENRHGSGTVEILGGKAYADPVTPALERRGFEVLEPLRGKQIGERKSSLNSMANE